MKTCFLIFFVTVTVAHLHAETVPHKTLPLPPWALEQRMPTNNAEIMAYVLAVTPYLEPHTLLALEKAYETHAPTGHILALVYEDNLRKRLIDYGHADTHSEKGHTSRALDELQKSARTFAERLQVEHGSRLWDDDPQNPFSVAGMLHGIQRLEELQERYETTDDPLDDLENYSFLFHLPGATMTLYRWMEQAVRKVQVNRAENLMRFLLRPENQNEFTVGNTYFWRGVTYEDWYRDYTNAFISYLMVHRYAASMGYTANAYFYAAGILSEWRMPRHALALLVLEIPSSKFDEFKTFNHIKAADICFNMSDIPGAMRHLQAAVRADTQNRHAEFIEWNFRRYPYPEKRQELWEQLAAQPWGPEDIENAICDALLSEKQPPAQELFIDALMHGWALPDEVPLAIATNRVLNNAILKYKAQNISPVQSNE